MSPFTFRMFVLGLASLGAVGCQSAAKSQALTSATPATAAQVPAPPPVPKFQPGDYVEGFRQPGASYAPLTVPKDARMVKVE